MRGIDPQMWKLVLTGYTMLEGSVAVPLTQVEIKENDRLYGLDSKAMSIFYCGLNRTEYNRISSCTTSTEIWTRLEVTHEGTDEVKETNIRTLTRKYENFKMVLNENIDSFFFRFTEIVNPLMTLGRKFTQAELVSKALWSLKGSEWKNKRNAIEEGKDIKSMTFEGLMGKLKAFEVQTIMEDEEDHPQRAVAEVKEAEKKLVKEEKNIAFKTSKSGKQHKKASSDSEDSSDDEIALMTQGFKRYLKHNKKKTGSAWGNRRMIEGGDAQSARCFNCNEKGHFKANCPQLKFERGRGKEPEKNKPSYKHGMRATWGHSEDEISSSDDEMATPICFMAIGNAAKVRPPPIYSDDMIVDEDMFDNMEDAYAFMLELIKDMIKKLKASKRHLENLEDDKEQLSQDVSTLRRKNVELSLKLDEPKKIVKEVDTTLVDKLNRDILDAKDKVNSLEKLELQLAKKLTEKCSVIGLKEAELKMANEKISIFEDKCLKMEKDLSTLKGKEKVNETSVSFISNVQLEKELNMRIDELLQDNSKMKATLKGFTDSSVYMGRMLDGIGNHSQRQGIGFNSNTSSKRGNPPKFLRNIFTMYQVILLCMMTRISLMNPTLRSGVIFAIVLVI